jgi:hypothetical protein
MMHRTACALSLVILIATVLFWLRSYWPDELHLCSRGGRMAFIFVEGARAIKFGPKSDVAIELDEVLSGLKADARHDWLFLGLEFIDGPDPSPQAEAYVPASWARYRTAGEYRMLVVPYVYPFGMLGTTSAFFLAAVYRKRGRIRAGHCMQCGYDLRATPRRCPECGTAPAKGSPVPHRSRLSDAARSTFV